MTGLDLRLQQRLDGNYRFQRHVYDVTREYYLLGRDTLIDELAPPIGGAVLEIGCGTARNLMRAAERYPTTALFGVDLSTLMLETAGRKLASHPDHNRITLALGDATTFDAQALFGRATFDRVYFSYALSMIPQWQKALAHAADLLSPAGSLHVVDFGTGRGLPVVANTLLRTWLEKFHVEPRDGLVPELERLSLRSDATALWRPLYSSYAIYAAMSRARPADARSPPTPRSPPAP